MFKIDVFMSSLWDFFTLNKRKILPIFTKRDIIINLNNRIYKIDDEFSSDLIELIHFVYKKGSIIESIKSFFDEIKEKIFFDYSAIREYSDIIGINSYLDMFVFPAIEFNSEKNTYKIPNFLYLKRDFGDIVDKFRFMFPEHLVFSGDLSFLHINSFGIITGATVKTNIGYVTYKAPYCEKVCIFNENKLKEKIFSESNVSILIDRVKNENITIFTGLDGNKYNLNYFFKKVTLETNKPSYVNYFYGTDLVNYTKNIYINNEHIEDYVCKYVKTHKGWNEKLQYIDNVLSNIANDYFSNIIKFTSKNISESAADRIKQIRVSKTADILNILNIELKAVKYNSFFTSNDIVCKINGVYETITISESGRNTFINRPELIESVKKIKIIYKKFKHIDEKEILSMVFNKIKVKSLSLNKITDLVYDGIWEVDNTLSLVTKNKYSNLDSLLENGIYPYAKHITLGGRDYKTLSTILEKIPNELADYYITFLKMIFEGKKKYRINIKDRYDVKKFIKHFIKSSDFIKQVNFSKLNSLIKNTNNSKIVFIGMSINDEYAFIDIDYDEYMGTKKEHGVEYQIKNFSSIFVVNLDEEKGIEFDDIPNGSGIIDSLIKYIFNCDNPKLRYKNVLEKIEEITF